MTSLSLSPPPFRNWPLQQTEMMALPLALIAVVLFWNLPETLSPGGRSALTITAFAVIGWTMTRLPDSLVAIAAALALVLTGTLPEDRLFASLGRDLVWLLVAAFVIASVLKSSGLMELLVARALLPFRTFVSVAYVLTLLIAGTAFFIPSTSGRAALLLPVFLALAAQLPDPRLIRPLALLFPTVILISAGGSLLGAGAHLIAVDAISQSGGAIIGYLEWITLGLPASLLSCLLATALILWLFVPRDLQNALLVLQRPTGRLTAHQKRLAAVLVMLLGLWTTAGLHNVSIVLIALAGALVLLSRPFTDRKTKEIFRDVDMELILYLTATIVIADAIIVTGADRWLADGMLSVLPDTLARNRAVAIGFMTLTAVMSHLVITSRSARAAVLIPAVALPIAAFGHDPALIVMVAVLGTGFCQTMMASAKPVAIYGGLEQPTFDQRDLFRLAVPLMPAVAMPLVLVAVTLWPWQLDLNTPAKDHMAAIVPLHPAAASTPQATSDLVPSSSSRPVLRPDRVVATTTPKPKPQRSAPSRRVTRFEAELTTVAREVRQSVRILGQKLGLR
ncbi:SLC13 family permease [Roseobacter sp.]|uniref:SLC13 family permease n=1 Tax=Roseobacter sp. TaxID=1907202 RepID=UPI0029665314|nr:SLC13 family permease [Roseobacter sp.]MDW3183447.1 SLC13 family permease [Roseobacter sp.]